ncbi:MMPL family transporter [Agrococcus jejuensis]|uniref:Putative drug exporter of the RND superfamily n=1 Tax=Agrococcus jejuensis TaxID=399736 RepID=A0A1G8F858_9MICO|nr:MMPL family transporter [Agrococcus jejuensis]SDH78255.1 putative drug exporter of the RND superfamily [Agrococcus jejuensis]
MTAPTRAEPQRSATPRVPRWLRAVIPAVLIVGWIAALGVGGPTFGRLDEVVENDQAAFLPQSADATAVQEALPGFLGDDRIPAIVVLEGDGALTDDQLADAQTLAEAVAAVDGVVEASPAIPSDDGEAVQIVAIVDSSESEAVDVAVDAIRDLVADAPDGLTGAVTGPAGFAADIAEAFSGIDGILLLVALAAVLVILVIVYRSPLLPILVLLTSVAALCLAILVVFSLAKAGILQLSGQTQGILFILVVGAATDYALLYTARYREALAQHARRWDATLAAWKGSFEPILASGGTVIAGLLCLLLSDLQSNRQLGPVAAIGIAMALLAGLTMLPALLYAVGRVAFWPVAPRHHGAHEHAPTHAKAEKVGLWGRVAALVGRRPRPVWIVTAIVLAAGAVGMTQLQPNGVPSSEFVVGESQARDGQAVLSDHFPGGSGAPTYVLAAEGDLEAVADVAVGVDGVDAVAATSEDAPGGTVPVDDAAPVPGMPTGEPQVVDGRVLLQLTLDAAPDSDAAQQAVRDLRAALADADLGDALVGGTTATAVDTNDTAIHDRALIIPIVLAVILVILALLLRAIVAPILLILTTVLSFGTALGVGALILHAMGREAMDPSVPLFAFVFLVALGVDYNIFLMTRVREEALRRGHREGVLTGLRVTGSVITSAGVVLAATFAALAVIPVLFLLQIAIIVALGVLIDTVLVRSLLVPALSLEIGRATWWPSRLSRGVPKD